MEQQQVLARQLALLLRVPPRGSAQLGVFGLESGDDAGQVGSRARPIKGDRDLVEDAAA